MDSELQFSRGIPTVKVESTASRSSPQLYAQFWNSHEFSDVLIKCRGEEFEVHKLVLSAHSKHFHKLVRTSPANVRQTLVIDHNPKPLESCLKFMYTGKLDLTPSELNEVTTLSRELQITSLHQICRTADLKDCSPTMGNCLEMYCAGRATSDDTMVDRAQPFVFAHFQALCMEDEFSGLCAQCVGELVCHPEITVTNAEQRLTAALDWVNHEPKERGSKLSTILQGLPLKEMGSWFLTYTIKTLRKQKNHEACDAIEYAMKAQADEAPSLSVSQRGSQNSHVPCVISLAARKYTNSKFDKPADKMWAIPFTPGGKYKLLSELPTPAHGKGGIASALQDNKVYVTGVGSDMKGAQCFRLDSGTWSKIGDLTKARERHAMALAGGKLYAIGGRKPGSADSVVTEVEVLNNQTGVWEVVGNLMGTTCLNTSCTVTGEGKIMIGGITDKDKQRVIQCYDPTNQSTLSKARFSGGDYTAVHGIVSTPKATILFEAFATYICPVNKSDAKQSDHYVTPNIGCSVALSQDGKHVLAIGGISKEKGPELIHRALVEDILDDNSNGWQCVNMDLPLGQCGLWPGAQCSGSIPATCMAN